MRYFQVCFYLPEFEPAALETSERLLVPAE